MCIWLVFSSFFLLVDVDTDEVDHDRLVIGRRVRPYGLCADES